MDNREQQTQGGETPQKSQITFAEHKASTASDLRQFGQMIEELATTCEEGNLATYEEFWISDGTAEGDAKIWELRERLVLRYVYRQELMRAKDTSGPPQSPSAIMQHPINPNTSSAPSVPMPVEPKQSLGLREAR